MTVAAASLVLVSLLMSVGCSNQSGNEWQRLVVEVSAINEGTPLLSGYLNAGPDRRVGTEDDYAPIDYVDVTFHARPYNQFIVLPEDTPYSYFHITEYDLEWTPLTPGADELVNYNMYSIPTDVLVPTGENATIVILIADRYMKEQPFYSDLFFNDKLPFQGACRLTFRGHETGTDNVVEVAGSFMVSFMGVVIDQ
jgi:hypothetical protein